jgi:hypothetical protein
MSEDAATEGRPVIQTFVVYGYQLGGPGRWNLTGFGPGDELRVPWYDERNPAHDLPERAVAQITPGVVTSAANRRIPRGREPNLPFIFDAAVELSAPGWTREASAPPSPANLLPPDTGVYALDQPTIPRFVLFIVDSAVDVESSAGYGEDDDQDEDDESDFVVWDHRLDWDSVLDAALTELGLQALGMPDWYWYRTGTP